MLVTSKQLLSWPPAADGSTPPITYYYAAATMPQKLQFKRELQATGARFVSPTEVRRHLRDFVLACDPDAERDRASTLLDAEDMRAAEAAKTRRRNSNGREKAEAAAAKDAAAEAQAAADAEFLRSVREAAKRQWEPYRQALADQDYWWEMTCLCAVRLLLRGVEGPDAPAFSAPHGLVDDLTLARLGMLRIQEVAPQILKAMALQEDEAKN